MDQNPNRQYGSRTPELDDRSFWQVEANPGRPGPADCPSGPRFQFAHRLGVLELPGRPAWGIVIGNRHARGGASAMYRYVTWPWAPIVELRRQVEAMVAGGF